MEDTIPYDLVSTKVSHWYLAVKNNWVGRAKILKEEVEEELKAMEENQDVLLYYSLVSFRHDLMLSYLEPQSVGDIDRKYRDLKKDEEKIPAMLEYYFHFFMGMYEFRRKELVVALTCYRNAEKQLDLIEDEEIEKAEFYFKVSEVYYFMKQTYFSMNYARRAYKIYQKYPTYGERRVQCQFVISGNWLDNMRYDDALEHAEQALKDSKELGKNHLIGSSHFNIGICYNQLEELDKAAEHFQKALDFHRLDSHSYELKALFNLAYVKAKQNKMNEAAALYSEGKQLAEKYDNRDIIEKLKLVKGLYLSYDLDIVRETFEFFKSRSMYADMEEYAIAVADLLTGREEIQAANEFYRIAIEARRQIQRGEQLHED